MILTLFRNVEHTHVENNPGQPHFVAQQQQEGEGGASDALLIKISWVAVFDPQHVIVVSSELHEKCNAGAA